MATTTREGGAGGGSGGSGGGRERDNRRFSKKAASSKPSDKKPILHSSTSFNKPVPNYLKPTFSSRLNPPSSSSSSTTTTTRTTPRRPTAAAPTTKPSFDRARSFDVRDIKTSRATSSKTSSIKPTGPQRSFSMLPSRSAKPAVVSLAPPIRRSLSTRVPPVAALKKQPGKKSGAKSVTLDPYIVDVEAHDQDPLDNMIGSQDDQDEVVSLPEISEMPGQEEPLGDPVMIEEAHLVQNDEKVVEEEASNEKVDDEQNGESPVEGSSGEGVVEEEEESANVEEKHVVVELEEEKVEDEQVVEKDASPAKEDTSVTQSGKQRESQDYNDVIEEAASKLMENRRNKVRALAGAFETVISLQDK